MALTAEEVAAMAPAVDLSGIERSSSDSTVTKEKSPDMLLSDANVQTAATVRSDGRVDLKITDRHCKIAQRLVPLLHPTQSRVDPDAVPAWLTTRPGEKPVPPLNIVIMIVGSRGDVQPFVAMAKELKDNHGHRIRLATHATFKNFVEENGIEFFNIGGDPANLMDYMVKNPGMLPGKQSLKDGDVGKRKGEIKEILTGCWRACIEPGDGMDHSEDIEAQAAHWKPFIAQAIIANPPGFAHVHCAEKLGIRFHLMFTMPWTPTQAFPHPLANVQSTSAEPSVANYVSYPLINFLTWQGLGGIINEFREDVLGLEPASVIWTPLLYSTAKIPFTYCWYAKRALSPALIPKPRDWGSHIAIAGFYFLPLASTFKPDPALLAFLQSGPPPVYIGFGSIVVKDPDAMTHMIFDAVKKAGVRALVSKGWGGLGGESLEVPDNIYLLGNVPHDWLFQHVSSVCHHGGAGTTAAGIAAGRPTIVVPFFGDQPFWGAMIAKSGAGPKPIPYKHLTAETLAQSIEFCFKPKVTEAAQAMSEQMKGENGPATGAKHFLGSLPRDRHRCAILSDKAAVWRIKRTNVRLSALASAVLCEAGLLAVDNLKLNRVCEYDLSEQPTDPISGGITSLLGAFANFMVGTATLPSDVLKKKPTRTSTDPSMLAHRTSTSTTLAAIENGNQHTNGAKPAGPLAHRGSTDSDISFASYDDDEHTPTAAVRAYHAIGKDFSHLAKLPREFTLGLARGFHNAPKLYHDHTVRKPDKVTDFHTGMAAAGKEFGLQLYDAITGVVTQPYHGAREEGAVGFLKGAGKGIGGLLLKPEAAVLGGIGLTFDAVYKHEKKQYRHHITHGHGHKATIEERVAALWLIEGHDAFNESSEEQRQFIVQQFKDKQARGEVEPISKFRHGRKCSTPGTDDGSTVQFRTFRQ